MARNRKVIRYRRPFHLNIGVIIFAAIFVYLAFSLYAYAKRDKVQFYEVSEGSIVNDKTYTGIIFFSLSYYDADFGSVYSAQYALQSSVAEYMNINAMDSLDAALQEHGINYQQITTGEAGVVSYAVDGYEGIDSTTVTPELFDRTKYSRKSIKSGELTEAGTPVYKLISSEDWSLVFPLDEESEQNFADRRSLTIKPAASDLKLVGRYSTFAGTDGTKYGKLDFDKYMIEYCADRFMDFEVISDEARGLKIPVTSIVEREFFTIPVAYLTGGGDANPGENGFLKEVYGENGESSVEFTPVEIFNQDENYVYVEKVEEGATITVYVATPGEQDPVEVPNLVGLTVSEAKEKLEDAGLELDNARTEYRASSQERGTIIGHESLGEKVLPGTKIAVYVSTGNMPTSATTTESTTESTTASSTSESATQDSTQPTTEPSSAPTTSAAAPTTATPTTTTTQPTTTDGPIMEFD